MKLNNYIYLLLVLLGLSLNSSASHLMGGDVTYSFTSYNPNTNLYTYAIRVEVYRYCDSTSGTTPSPLDQSITMGIYSQNPTLPNANKNLYNKFHLFLESKNCHKTWWCYKYNRNNLYIHLQQNFCELVTCYLLQQDFH